MSLGTRLRSLVIPAKAGIQFPALGLLLPEDRR